MGHIHLKVAAIPDTVAFYRDLLGFGLVAQLGSQAAYLRAGGDHHHIGANTSESVGAPPRRLEPHRFSMRRSCCLTRRSEIA